MDDAEKARLKKELMQRLGLSTKEEAIAKSVTELTDKDKLKMMTNLLPDEDASFATLSVIADRYKLPWLRQTVDERLELRMSVSGWKANQIVTVATEKMKEIRRSLRDRIFHRNEKGSKWQVEEFE